MNQTQKKTVTVVHENSFCEHCHISVAVIQCCWCSGPTRKPIILHYTTHMLTRLYIIFRGIFVITIMADNNTPSTIPSTEEPFYYCQPCSDVVHTGNRKSSHPLSELVNIEDVSLQLVMYIL